MRLICQREDGVARISSSTIAAARTGGSELICAVDESEAIRRRETSFSRRVGIRHCQKNSGRSREEGDGRIRLHGVYI